MSGVVQGLSELHLDPRSMSLSWSWQNNLTRGIRSLSRDLARNIRRSKNKRARNQRKSPAALSLLFLDDGRCRQRTGSFSRHPARGGAAGWEWRGTSGPNLLFFRDTRGRCIEACAKHRRGRQSIMSLLSLPLLVTNSPPQRLGRTTLPA